MEGGQTSNQYFDKYLFESDPQLLADIADQFCIIEDVVTTGGQILISTSDLKEFGAEITTVMSVIERDPQGRANLEDAGLTFISLFKMEELMQADAGS